MDRPNALVYTEAASFDAPPDRRFLDMLGGPICVVSGLRWSSVFPGGDLEASATLNTRPDFTSVGLQPGRRSTIIAGGGVRFQGTLDEPQRGDPWTLHLTGYSGRSTQYGAGNYAFQPGGINLDAIVDDAIGRGLPWTRNGVSLGLPAGSPGSTNLALDQALAAYNQATETFWKLTPQLLGGKAWVTNGPAPTVAKYQLAASQVLNPTLQGYFTQVLVTYNYQSGVFGSSPIINSVLVGDDPADGRFGSRETFLDITDQGNFTGPGVPTNQGQAWLDANKPQLRYTNSIIVQPGQLTVPGGGPVDLKTVRAGDLVQVIDVDPSHAGFLSPGPLLILTGKADYDTVTETLTLTPLGALGQDFESILYQGLGGAV